MYIHTAGPQGVGDIDNDGDIDIFVITDYYNFSEDIVIHINQDGPIEGLQVVNSGGHHFGSSGRVYSNSSWGACEQLQLGFWGWANRQWGGGFPCVHSHRHVHGRCHRQQRL